MGRPPCCDKMGVKKGPWTPEEDIMLVSYVQEHGPGNWRAVPTNTGLRRCSKSCRLRWTNYLRPGIKRGEFTADEEKMIIQLQDLLGNKWAAIASYLPERTDNDIKNYWNTHLKKKLKKLQTPSDDMGASISTREEDGLISSSSYTHSISRGQWERRLQTNIHMAKQALSDALSLDQKPINTIPHPFKPNETTTPSSCTTTPYASSTENIAKLLKGWMKNSPQTMSSSSTTTQHSIHKINDHAHVTDSNELGSESKNSGIDLSEAFESLFGFESLDSNSNISDFSTKSNNNNMSPEEAASNTLFQGESKPDHTSLVPFSVLENWLLDEGATADHLF